MGRGVDAPDPQLQRLGILQIPVVPLIQHAVSKRAPAPHAEAIPLQPRPVRIDVKELRAGLVPAADHGAHAETHAFVRVDEIGEVFGGRGDGDAFFVAELVQTALDAEVRLPTSRQRESHSSEQRRAHLPVLAVCCAASHRPEEVRVDLDHCAIPPSSSAQTARATERTLLDRPAGNVASCRRPRVDGDDDASLEPEREGGGAVADLDPRIGHSIVSVLAQEGRRLCMTSTQLPREER